MSLKNLPWVVALLWASATNSLRSASVTLEAEAAMLGINFVTNTSSGVTYISNTNNNTDAGGPLIPGRVASYTVIFPEPGSYQLFARVRVGSGDASDDSFFYGNGFGVKSPTLDADWIRVNSVNTGGFTNPGDEVTGSGSASINVWKWINLSEYTGAAGAGESPISFTVSANNLTNLFQIGGREDGLDMDKFLFGTSNYIFTVAELDAGGPGTPPAPPTNPPAITSPRDLVAGNLIQLNDNGGWSWYMDERAIVDAPGGKLVTGSDATGAGVGGSSRNGAVEAVIFDLQTQTSHRFTLFQGSPLGADDHNAPAFMLRPDGKYLSQWTGHNNNWLSYFRVYDGINWGAANTFDWAGVGAGANEQASYSNPHYLPAENRTYTFVRSLDIKSMNMLVSSNYGDTWTYYGKLNRSYSGSGYNPGYYRFSDNGLDRIDFICTESHPRDTLTSMYHGYISNGMSFKSDGTVVDANLNDTNAPLSSDFMPIFANGTVMPVGQTNYRCWNSDVQLYPDGTVQAIIHARINQSAHIGGYPDQEDPNHAFFFCRWDGTKWTTTYLCQAGYKLYYAEADYVGLGALSPNDPDTIFVSTRYDPRAVAPGVTDTNQPYSDFREIWKGVTTDHGASFTWTQITRDSLRDNFRPIVPAWDANNTALLWFRGTYFSAQSYDASVVGIVEHRSEISGPKTFVDATTGNTTLATGDALVTGSGANQWHERSGEFNGGTVLASADVAAESGPALRTGVGLPQAGTYDVWVNFWGNPAADWRIKAGFATNQMNILRQIGSQQVEPGQYASALVLTNNGTNFLYQAYVGRVTGSSVEVFVEDEPIQTGTVSTTIDDTARTWYDGVSFAKVETYAITDVAYDESGHSVTITWSSASTERSLTTPTYSLLKKAALTDSIWTTIATGIASAGNTTSFVETNAVGDAAFYRVSIP